MSGNTIPARFFALAKSRNTQPAYHVYQGGAWVPHTWGTYGDQVTQVARALLSLGVAKGDKTCILGFNRPEWVIFDVASMAIGAVPAGIYTTCSPTEVQYIIDHAEAAVVLLEDEDQWEKVKAERHNLPSLRHVVMMEGAPAIDDSLVMSWEEFLAKADGTEASEVDSRMSGLADDDLATFIYTSGTTGPPKAVMLTHGNLAWTAKVACDLVDLNSTDTGLSYLPLSHIAEQMFSIHAPMTVGSQVYFAESLIRMPQNLQEVQPTVFFAVPRVWEKFYAGVSGKLAKAEGAKAKIAAWAMGVGRKVNAKRNAGESVGGLLALQYRLATKLIFSKVKPAIGMANAKTCVTGAAPISSEILEFFSGLDLPIREVYGQSEDCGPTTFNLAGRTRIGSVGPAIPGVEVKIAEDGEILVKGPNVFVGYYRDEGATEDTLKDGWLLTGDLGAFDDDGFLHITGRKKDIIITAGGKNIAPKNIELALSNLPLVGQAVVIGDRRKFLSALITLDEEGSAGFAQTHSLPVEGLHDNAGVLEEIQAGVNTVNELFARVEHVRKFTVLPRAFSVEEGELTPTLKIKRKVVHEHFHQEIDGMYL